MILKLILEANFSLFFGRNSDSDSDNESGDPEKKKMQEKLSGILFITDLSKKNLMCLLCLKLSVVLNGITLLKLADTKLVDVLLTDFTSRLLYKCSLFKNLV